MVTLESGLTLEPGAGSVERTVPKGPPRRLLTSTLSPASSRIFLASSWLLPVTSGIVTFSGPLETVRSTESPL